MYTAANGLITRTTATNLVWARHTTGKSLSVSTVWANLLHQRVHTTGWVYALQLYSHQSWKRKTRPGLYQTQFNSCPSIALLLMSDEIYTGNTIALQGFTSKNTVNLGCLCINICDCKCNTSNRLERSEFGSESGVNNNSVYFCLYIDYILWIVIGLVCWFGFW